MSKQDNTPRSLPIRGNRRPDYLPSSNPLQSFNSYTTNLLDRDKLEILEYLFNNYNIEELKVLKQMASIEK